MIHLLLPAYNEEKGIGKLLEDVVRISARIHEPIHVVVINDGSRDNTSEVVRSFSGRLDIQLIEFPKNRGVAEVFRTGFKEVIRLSPEPETDIVITMDSDNTQDSASIVQLLEKIRSGFDIVIASRFQKGGKMIGCPFRREILSIGVSWLMRFVVGVPGVTDYSTFYRAYRVSVLKQGFEAYGDSILEGKGFSIISSFLVKLANLTDRITEVPSVLHYHLKGGRSGNNIPRTIQGYLQLIWLCWKTHRFRLLLPAAAGTPQHAR